MEYVTATILSFADGIRLVLIPVLMEYVTAVSFWCNICNY